MELLWQVLIPVLIFIGLGLLAGLLLAVFSKVFAVKTDERAEQVLAALPGLNCGVCGYSGCENYANEIVKNGAPTNRCVPGGDKAAREISEILGTRFEDVKERVAFVGCNGHVPEATHDSFIYQGEPTCAACDMYYRGKGICNYGCIGYGDCVKQCAYDAITIVNEVARVIPERCIGCSMCARACPKDLIHLRDAMQHVYVACSSCDTGKKTIQTCENGCIACKRCEKTCPNDAIHVVNNVAVIDYDKCISCEECAKVCPKHCIVVSKKAFGEIEETA